jgi:hypothetical protein
MRADRTGVVATGTLKRSEISLASLERRIADLEAFYALESSGGRSGELTRKAFVSGFLKAMAHVRRAPIDRPPWGYEASKLHDLSPFNLAQYVAALTVQEHPDEEEARKILKSKGSKGEDPGLLGLIDVVVGHRFRGRP